MTSLPPPAAQHDGPAPAKLRGVRTILVIVNFVVITKGSGRIAEVAARFHLDAMPGKQMAVDADLSAAKPARLFRGSSPGPAQHRRKLVAVPRIAEIAHPAADEWDPDHNTEALDVEESLQQFLPPRWRRVAA
jgi:hypothetical protein